MLPSAERKLTPHIERDFENEDDNEKDKEEGPSGSKGKEKEEELPIPDSKLDPSIQVLRFNVFYMAGLHLPLPITSSHLEPLLAHLLNEVNFAQSLYSFISSYNDILTVSWTPPSLVHELRCE